MIAGQLHTPTKKKEQQGEQPAGHRWIEIENEHACIAVVPGLGAGIGKFVVRTRDGDLHLMRRAEENVSYFNDLACYVMCPWSNRIEGDGRGRARVLANGGEHYINSDWPDGTAIHGVTKSAAWTLVDRSPLSVRCRLVVKEPAEQGHWPWAFEAFVRYELAGTRFLAELTIINVSKEPMPSGGGFHPFWNRRLQGGECCQLMMHTDGRYPADKMLPTSLASQDNITKLLSAGVSVDELNLDDVFLGNVTGAQIRWNNMNVTYATNCGHSVVYAPPVGHPLSGVFCFEPVSMVNNGYALRERGWNNTGVVMLEPGARQQIRWSVDINVI